MSSGLGGGSGCGGPGGSGPSPTSMRRPVGVVQVRVPLRWLTRCQPGAWCLRWWWWTQSGARLQAQVGPSGWRTVWSSSHGAGGAGAAGEDAAAVPDAEQVLEPFGWGVRAGSFSLVDVGSWAGLLGGHCTVDGAGGVVGEVEEVAQGVGGDRSEPSDLTRQPVIGKPCGPVTSVDDDVDVDRCWGLDGAVGADAGAEEEVDEDVGSLGVHAAGVDLAVWPSTSAGRAWASWSRCS